MDLYELAKRDRPRKSMKEDSDSEEDEDSKSTDDDPVYPDPDSNNSDSEKEEESDDEEPQTPPRKKKKIVNDPVRKRSRPEKKDDGPSTSGPSAPFQLIGLGPNRHNYGAPIRAQNELRENRTPEREEPGAAMSSNDDDGRLSFGSSTTNSSTSVLENQRNYASSFRSDSRSGSPAADERNGKNGNPEDIPPGSDDELDRDEERDEYIPSGENSPEAAKDNQQEPEEEELEPPARNPSGSLQPGFGSPAALDPGHMDGGAISPVKDELDYGEQDKGQNADEAGQEAEGEADERVGAQEFELEEQLEYIQEPIEVNGGMEPMQLQEDIRRQRMEDDVRALGGDMPFLHQEPFPIHQDEEGLPDQNQMEMFDEHMPVLHVEDVDVHQVDVPVLHQHHFGGLPNEEERLLRQNGLHQDHLEMFDEIEPVRHVEDIGILQDPVLQHVHDRVLEDRPQQNFIEVRPESGALSLEEYVRANEAGRLLRSRQMETIGDDEAAHPAPDVAPIDEAGHGLNFALLGENFRVPGVPTLFDQNRVEQRREEQDDPLQDINPEILDLAEEDPQNEAFHDNDAEFHDLAEDEHQTNEAPEEIGDVFLEEELLIEDGPRSRPESPKLVFDILVNVLVVQRRVRVPECFRAANGTPYPEPGERPPKRRKEGERSPQEEVQQKESFGVQDDYGDLDADLDIPANEYLEGQSLQDAKPSRTDGSSGHSQNEASPQAQNAQGSRPPGSRSPSSSESPIDASGLNHSANSPRAQSPQEPGPSRQLSQPQASSQPQSPQDSRPTSPSPSPPPRPQRPQRQSAIASGYLRFPAALKKRKTTALRAPFPPPGPPRQIRSHFGLDPSGPNERDEWFDRLGYPIDNNGEYVIRGEPQWLKWFLAREKVYFDRGQFNINIHQNGHDYKEKIGNFSGVHLFQRKDGLKMKIPEDLCLKTVTKYINPDIEIFAISSGTPQQIGMTVQELVDKFDIPEDQREHILNMISLEFAQLQTDLDKHFEVPEFVRQRSMVNTLHHAVDEEIAKVEEKLKEESLDKDEKKRLSNKLISLKKQKTAMPKYQKFLLLSMAGSFTDVHVDLSATCVFYHVVKGRKIFYVAKATPENLELYKKFEKKEMNPEEWIGCALKNEWLRVEIKEGETAMIPSGYIHFVYTPEDSVVIGGNFLLVQFAEQQFDLTTLEEDVLKMFNGRHGSITADNMFKGFKNVMWSYLEHCMLPLMESSSNFGPRHPLYPTAQIFLREMDFTQFIRESWYKQQERKDLENRLRELMGVQAKRKAPEDQEEMEGYPRAKKSSAV